MLAVNVLCNTDVNSGNLSRFFLHHELRVNIKEDKISYIFVVSAEKKVAPFCETPERSTSTILLETNKLTFQIIIH